MTRGNNSIFILAIAFFISYELLGPVQFAFQTYLRLPTFIPAVVLILAVACRANVFRYVSFADVAWTVAWITLMMAFLCGYDEFVTLYSVPMILNQWFRSAACVLAVSFLCHSHDIRLLRIVVIIACLAIATECTLTILQLLRDPEIVRNTTLADRVSGEYFKTQVIFEAKRNGIASYAYIHAVPILVPGLVALCKCRQIGAVIRWCGFMLCMLILVFLVKCQFATPTMLGFGLFFLALGWSKNKVCNLGYLFLLGVFALVVKFWGNDLLKIVLEPLSHFFTEGTLATKIEDALNAASSSNYSSQADGRSSLYQMTWDAFFANPLWGNKGHVEYIGGHCYFADLLAYFGLIWIIPLFVAMVCVFKKLGGYLTGNFKVYYFSACVGYVALGFVKNLGANEYYDIIFLVLPSLLMYCGMEQEGKMWRMWRACR